MDNPNPSSQPKAELASHRALESLITNLESILDSAIKNVESINGDGLAQLLSLMSSVILEIQSVFSRILSTLVRLKYFHFDNEEHLQEVLHSLERYRYDHGFRRDRYFCHRLRELCESYETLIVPELLKANIQNLDEWLSNFFDFSNVRFSYLRIQEMATRELLSLIRQARSEDSSEEKYELIRNKAAEYIEVLNNYLAELQDLNNKILGLSGRTGFLELVNDPKRLKQTQVSIVKDITMTTNEAPKYDMRGSSFPGGFAETNYGNMVETQHNYASEQKQTLARAANEIQNLLKQLEQSNPTATEIEKMEYINDETTPSFKRRVVGALQAGGEAAIEEFLDNPYVNVGKATIKGWMKPE